LGCHAGDAGGAGGAAHGEFHVVHDGGAYHHGGALHHGGGIGAISSDSSESMGK